MANQIHAVVTSDALRDELHTQSFAEFMKLSWDATAHKLVGAYTQHAQLVGAK